MEELVTIRFIAKELNISYHSARNRLLRNAEAEELKQKFDHTVLYPKKVVEILRACDQ